MDTSPTCVPFSFPRTFPLHSAGCVCVYVCVCARPCWMQQQLTFWSRAGCSSLVFDDYDRVAALCLKSHLARARILTLQSLNGVQAHLALLMPCLCCIRSLSHQVTDSVCLIPLFMRSCVRALEAALSSISWHSSQ